MSKPASPKHPLNRMQAFQIKTRAPRAVFYLKRYVEDIAAAQAVLVFVRRGRTRRGLPVQNLGLYAHE